MTSKMGKYGRMKVVTQGKLDTFFLKACTSRLSMNIKRPKVEKYCFH